MRFRLTFGLCATLLIAMLSAGCGGDGPTAATPAVPTATATAAATVAPTPGPFDSMGDVDFEQPALAGPLIDRAGGGEVHAERVLLEDLTGDGEDEAVVVVESGGTLGDVAVAVYTLDGRSLQELLFERLNGHAEVRLGLVVLQEGVYGAGDAECCPSQLRERVYGWRDGTFELLSEQVVENPRR